MRTLKESILADIESNIKNGDNIELCNRLLSNKQKQMNDAIIDLKDKIENIKTNEVDLESTAINSLNAPRRPIVTTLLKFFVIDGKYNLSICKFMYAGIWNILNIFFK